MEAGTKQLHMRGEMHEWRGNSVRDPDSRFVMVSLSHG